VEATFRDHFKLDLRVIDAAREFLNGLKGVLDPRKTQDHRQDFIDVFKREAATIKGGGGSGGGAKFLAQGTLYPTSSNPATATPAPPQHQAPPQRRRPAAELGLNSSSPFATSSRTKSASSANSSACPKPSSGAIPSPARPGRALRRRDHRRTPGHPARCRRNLPRRNHREASTAKPPKLRRILPSAPSASWATPSYQHVIALRSVDTSDFMTCWSRIPYEVLARVTTASSTSARR